VWTLDELQNCRQHLYPQLSEEQTEDRFGGVVWSVLAQPERSFDDLRASLSAEEAVAVYRAGAQGLKSDIRHAYLHIRVSQLDAKVTQMIVDHCSICCARTLDCMHMQCKADDTLCLALSSLRGI
jgi:hypothetical protein